MLRPDPIEKFVSPLRKGGTGTFVKVLAIAF